MGIVIAVLGAKVADAHKKAVNTSSEISAGVVMKLFAPAEQKNDEDNFESSIPLSGLDPAERGTRRHLWICFHELLLIVFLLVLFGLLERGDPGVYEEGYCVRSHLLFTTITATTVGYGSAAPETTKGRFVASIFIPLIVAATGHWIGVVASCVIDIRQNRLRKQPEIQQLSLNLLDAMDSDDDGRVTLAEFLEFMLIAMNKVDKELLQDLRAHFARLDTNDRGFLSKDALIFSARQRLHTTTRKLDLARYKQELLNKSGHSSDI